MMQLVNPAVPPASGMKALSFTGMIGMINPKVGDDRLLVILQQGVSSLSLAAPKSLEPEDVLAYQIQVMRLLENKFPGYKAMASPRFHIGDEIPLSLERCKTPSETALVTEWLEFAKKFNLRYCRPSLHNVGIENDVGRMIVPHRPRSRFSR